MGICDSGNNRNKQEKKISEPFVNKKENQRSESTKKINIIEECIIKKYEDYHSLIFLNPFEKMESSSNVAKSICKVKAKNRIGTGFLLEFFIDQEKFICLISNEHVIKSNNISSNTTIYISYDLEKKKGRTKFG